MMCVVSMSFGVGLVSVGVFGLLGHFGVLQYSPRFPLMSFGMALIIFSLWEHRKVRG